MGMGKKYAVEILLIHDNSAITASSSGYGLKKHAHQPDWVGKPPTKTSLKRDKGVVPLDVQLIKNFCVIEITFFIRSTNPSLTYQKQRIMENTKQNILQISKHFQCL